MINVAFSPAFKRSFRKRLKHNHKLQDRFWVRLDCFIQDPFDPQLKTHKLTGQLKELWSFSVEHDVRPQHHSKTAHFHLAEIYEKI